MEDGDGDELPLKLPRDSDEEDELPLILTRDSVLDYDQPSECEDQLPLKLPRESDDEDELPFILKRDSVLEDDQLPLTLPRESHNAALERFLGSDQETLNSVLTNILERFSELDADGSGTITMNLVQCQGSFILLVAWIAYS